MLIYNKTAPAIVSGVTTLHPTLALPRLLGYTGRIVEWKRTIDMKSSEQNTPEPAENTPAEPTENTEVKPDDAKPLDPKEIARQRSKDDLARKRRNAHGNRGRF